MQLGLVQNIPAALNIDVKVVRRRQKKKMSAVDFVLCARARERVCFYDQILLKEGRKKTHTKDSYYYYNNELFPVHVATVRNPGCTSMHANCTVLHSAVASLSLLAIFFLTAAAVFLVSSSARHHCTRL